MNSETRNLKKIGQEMHLDKIRETRAKMWSAKEVFDARKKREWEIEKALLSQDTYRAVWDAKADGVTVTAIAQAYGVSNRSVIYNVLREMPEGYIPNVIAPTEPEEDPTTDSAATYNPDNDTWTVTPPDSAATIVLTAVDTTTHRLRIHPDTTDATPADRADLNKARNNPDHWLWGVLKN